ncbi:hypothetical protein F5Y09DRAFT_327483 [Xylaria sp. FL1042]|nr:hypothetical protein F5Y09DRAFT_327483 [Xylaria sp. FL1042]
MEMIHNSKRTAPVIIHNLLPRPHTIEPNGEVQFCHPGYASPHDVLFQLPRLDHALDSTSTSTALKGVHHRTALTACQIIANNAYNGYLTTDRQGRERVDVHPDHVLTESQYWFFTSPDQQGPYPVVPSFRDWAFPHRSPLVTWPRPQPNATTDVDAIDHRCIVTQTAWLVNAAHLVPAADEEWFKINAMFQYGNHHDVNQHANKITLRHDIHYAFDSHLFAIVPKHDHYVVHQLHATTASTMEFASTYHNHMVQQPRDVAPEFLLARFARAVLMLAKPFIAQSPVRRHVARFGIVDSGGAEDEDRDGGADAYGTRLEWLSPAQLYKEYGGGGTKSASPSKRKRNDEKPLNDRHGYEAGEDDINDNDDDDDDNDHDSDNDASSVSDDRSDKDPDWYEQNIAVLLEDDRGRPQKRRRRCSSTDSNSHTLQSCREAGANLSSASTSASSFCSINIKQQASPAVYT